MAVFLTWGFTGSNWPWFMFVWAGLIGLEVLIYLKSRTLPAYQATETSPNSDVVVISGPVGDQTHPFSPPVGNSVPSPMNPTNGYPNPSPQATYIFQQPQAPNFILQAYPQPVMPPQNGQYNNSQFEFYPNLPSQQGNNKM